MPAVGSYTPDNPVAYCRACQRDFSGDTAFDKHRVGNHAYKWSPEHEDGRRCLDEEEIQEDFELDLHGRWRPKLTDEKRAALQALSQRKP